MSYYNNKAIIITGDGTRLKEAHSKAKQIFKYDEDGNKINMVSNIIGTGMNQFMHFFICPCGSKAEWSYETFFDEKYKEMINYLKSFNDEDAYNSMPLEDYFKIGSISWILVKYGDKGTSILDTNCEK